jgi:glycerol-3-phosphate dehydrogenase
VTRDYAFDLSGTPPMLSVYGGKITTFRRLAEHAMEKLAPLLGERGGSWTAAAPLPGGDFPVEGFEGLVARIAAAHPYLDKRDARRLARAYGTRVWRLLEGSRAKSDLGRDFGAGLFEREVQYLLEEEFARSGQDIVWRRSKLGLRMSPDEIAALDAYVAANAPVPRGARARPR